MAIHVKCLTCCTQSIVSGATEDGQVCCQGCGEPIRVAPRSISAKKTCSGKLSATMPQESPGPPDSVSRDRHRLLVMGGIGAAVVASVGLVAWIAFSSSGSQQPLEYSPAQSVASSETSGETPAVSTAASDNLLISGAHQAFDPASQFANSTPASMADSSPSIEKPPERQASVASDTPSQAMIVKPPVAESAVTSPKSATPSDVSSSTEAVNGPQPSFPEVRKELPEHVLGMLSALEQADRVELVRELLARIKQARESAKAHRKGYVIVGRLGLPGSVKPSDVIGSVPILEGGYFV